MDIVEKIQKLRREKGLSQEALAEALGVSRQSVSKWESGAVLPDTDKIIAMSELFGISTDFLLKGDFAPVTAPADGAAAPPQESKKKPKKAARHYRPRAYDMHRYNRRCGARALRRVS